MTVMTMECSVIRIQVPFVYLMRRLDSLFLRVPKKTFACTTFLPKLHTGKVIPIVNKQDREITSVLSSNDLLPVF